MDHCPPRDEDVFIDLESGSSTEEGSPNQKEFTRSYDQMMSLDDNLVKLSIDPLNIVKVVIESKVEEEKVGDFTGKKMGKEKRKKASSVKKPPKPPRPPRGFSLDAADQKLIKEIAELAMMKRARIERMKALKQKKALKASSLSSSMNGSWFAMLFTIIFFLMIFLQGMSCRSSGLTSQGSLHTSQTNENGLIFTQEQLNSSASDSILPDSKSSNLLEKISGSHSASKKSTVAE